MTVGDPYVGRGSIGGIEGSQAIVDATYVTSGDGGEHIFVVESAEVLEPGYEPPDIGDEITVNDYNKGVRFEATTRYLLFISDDLSGTTPLLRFAFDLDHSSTVPGHDNPARLADDGVHDGRPLADVVACLATELNVPSGEAALRQLGTDSDPAARLRPVDRSGSWLLFTVCDPGDDGTG